MVGVQVDFDVRKWALSPNALVNLLLLRTPKHSRTGFRFSLAGGAPCLNLYFPSWTLDTREKFWIAMLGIFLLSIATEGLSKTRSLLSKRLKGGIKRWTITLLHGLQALVGYILMLATMTFSVELLFCVILGLGTGFAIFYDDEDSHVTTNPCCNFIQEEFNERASALRQQHLEEEEKAREEQLPGGEQRAAELNEEDESELALTTNTV